MSRSERAAKAGRAWRGTATVREIERTRLLSPSREAAEGTGDAKMVQRSSLRRRCNVPSRVGGKQ